MMEVQSNTFILKTQKRQPTNIFNKSFICETKQKLIDKNINMHIKFNLPVRLLTNFSICTGSMVEWIMMITSFGSPGN